jgi:diketogulonate reductase-like aldo/keto reductase/flavodoxin
VKKIVSFILVFVCMVTLSACGSTFEAEQSSEAIIPTLQATALASGASTFIDVPEGAWYEEAVKYCLKNEILSGTSDTTFSPSDTMTRAMLAVVLFRMTDSPEVSIIPDFSDVASGAWYADAVAWASEKGIMSGYGNGMFGANDAITREQMATILWRYAGSPSDGTGGADFADASMISEWAVSAVNWMKSAGIISGKTDNRFAPNDNISRAEAAVMLYRWLNGAESGEKATGSKVLVAYFSATGTTRLIAEYAAEILNADLYEIVPETPYTTADLNYSDSSSRTTKEQNDPSARPAISGAVERLSDYDVVFLGYPIWHGQSPKIIRTFLESYDFSGKTIVPFCTSHSSGIGSSDTNLHSLCADSVNWLPGESFAAGASRDSMKEWIAGLGIQTGNSKNVGAFNFETKTVLLNSGYEMPIMGLGTYSLSDEDCFNSVTTLLEAGGRLIDTAYMYHNEASVGRAIRESTVPREDIFVITKLYPSQFDNAEAAIDEALAKLDIGYIDLMLLHHPGNSDVEAYHAMEKAEADGKIRSIGLSNWYVEELEEFLPQVSITPALVQNEIHPYYQENDVIPYIQSLGIVVQGWYPLGGRGHTAELLGNEVISEIAKAHGKSSAQVILRWNLQKGVVVIPGSSNADHIQENTELFDFELTDGEMGRINALDRNEKHDWY